MNLSFVHSSVGNWKIGYQLLANMYACCFSSLENDLESHLYHFSKRGLWFRQEAENPSSLRFEEYQKGQCMAIVEKRSLVIE